MPEVDKKAESITALKNANKHLSDVFADLNKKDQVLMQTASDLQSVARQCGDLSIRVWVGGKYEIASLKTYLEICAKTLNEAR